MRDTFIIGISHSISTYLCKRLGDVVFFFKKSDNPFLFRFYFCFPSICRAITLYIFSCLYLVVTSPLC